MSYKMTEQEALTELRRRFDEDTANTVYRLNGLLMERDAEIERLKALITELSDVLESYGFDELLDLIRRARAATA